MTDALRAAVARTLETTAGSATETRRRAQELLDEVVRRGQEAREEVSRRGERARQEVSRRGEEARREVARRGGEARREVVRRGEDAREVLSERITVLERRLAELEASLRAGGTDEGGSRRGSPDPPEGAPDVDR